MRLFCDEMLKGLGRWLRTAGYDTALAEGGLADAAIIARCTTEQRILITRDRHLETRAQGRVPVVRLAEDGLDAQALALRAVLGVDWECAPFTRCLVDNAPLDLAPSEMAAQVPPDSRVPGGPLRVCPSCGRLYWPGGHVRRMVEKLRGFSSA